MRESGKIYPYLKHPVDNYLTRAEHYTVKSNRDLTLRIWNGAKSTTTHTHYFLESNTPASIAPRMTGRDRI
jgi:hypothetical protein